MNTTEATESNERQFLKAARRIVVKVGTNSLVGRAGTPDLQRFKALTAQLAEAQQQGRQIILVTSAAIAAGVDALKIAKRPKEIEALQACAAVGQPILMKIYADLFSQYSLNVGQLLLTREDVAVRSRHIAARRALDQLLQQNIIPIVNENDAVAVDEIKFGDNDILASLVAVLLDADLLLLLSTTDGLRESNNPQSKRIRFMPKISQALLDIAKGKGSELSTGGMKSKLQSCDIALHSGIPCVIADGRSKTSVAAVLNGEDEGTLLGMPSRRQLSHLKDRKRWLAFFKEPVGSLQIDAGAVKALSRNNSSLLAVGISEVHGNFSSGALVNIVDAAGILIGRGLTSIAAAELRENIGPAKTQRRKPAVHRDNMLVFSDVGTSE